MENFCFEFKGKMDCDHQPIIIHKENCNWSKNDERNTGNSSYWRVGQSKDFQHKNKKGIAKPILKTLLEFFVT